MQLLDINTVQDIIFNAVWIVPVIVALTAALRGAFKIPSRYAPITAIVAGVAVCLLFFGTALAIFVGVVLGLAASGLYDFGKKTVAGA